MRPRTALAISVVNGFAIVTTATRAADAPLPLDPGRWRVQTVATGHGDMPAEILRVPPDRRAAAEQSWREQQRRPLHVETMQCVTADDLRLGRIFTPDDGCTQTVVQTSTQGWSIHEHCALPDGTRDTEYRLTIVSRGAVRASATVLERESGATRTGTVAVTATRVGAHCDADGSIAPE